MTTILDLAVIQISASPWNHRKKFTGLDELAASIKEKGLIAPITVRECAGATDYELVVGERRWRASKLAGLPTIPAIVRKLSDKEVLEIQLIENVQRVDVHPLEEADGYQELIDKHGYDVDAVAAKTGKSKAYVYARLKLCDLAPVPRKAFLADELNPSVALLIARIPDPKLQAQATNEVLGRAGYREYRESGIPEDRELRFLNDEGKQEQERLPLSVREAQLHVQAMYMLRLANAPFDTADATLVAKAGACATCPKRTGNQRELFSDVRSADVCTDPTCFDGKKKADWDRKSAAAARSGLRVLNDKEKKNVFDQYGDGTRINHTSAYVDPNDKLPYDLDPSQKKTWKSALGTATSAKAIALDGQGAARELLDRKSAIAVLEKAGKLKEIKREGKAKQAPNQYNEQRKKQEVESKRRHKVARLAFAELAEKGKDAAGVAFWQWLAGAVLRMVDVEDCRNLCKRREIETKLGNGQAEKALAKIVKETKTVDELLALIVEFAAAFRAVGGVWAGCNFGENFTGACEVLRVDLDKLKKQVLATEKEKAGATSPPKAAAKSKGKAK